VPPGFVPFHRSCHFNFVAIIRRYKIWTDQEQNDICFLQMVAYFVIELFTRTDSTIVPRFNNALPLAQPNGFPARLAGQRLCVSTRKTVLPSLHYPQLVR
jgi:hypothetical protein